MGKIRSIYCEKVISLLSQTLRSPWRDQITCNVEISNDSVVLCNISASICIYKNETFFYNMYVTTQPQLLFEAKHICRFRNCLRKCIPRYDLAKEMFLQINYLKSVYPHLRDFVVECSLTFTDNAGRDIIGWDYPYTTKILQSKGLIDVYQRGTCNCICYRSSKLK